MRSALAVALALGGLPAALATQPVAADLPAGMRVRVTAPSRDVHLAVGTLVRVSADSIVLAPVPGDGSSMALPRSAVTRFELSRGRQSPVLAGAIWAPVGAGSGALLGAMVGFANHFSDSCDPGATKQECQRKSDRVVGRAVSSGAAVGAILGVVAGATFGIVRRRERWRVVDVPLQVGIALPAGVAVSFAFGRP